ncbi:unnamed protein product, partial [Amoebophrya sp. A25]
SGRSRKWTCRSGLPLQLPEDVVKTKRKTSSSSAPPAFDQDKHVDAQGVFFVGDGCILSLKNMSFSRNVTPESPVPELMPLDSEDLMSRQTTPT